jgi:D-amino-acid dehydrogenase
MPLIGPLPGDPRVTLAVGHGTLGITLAPVTGELVADLVTGVEAESDPLLDPARFRRAPRPRLSRRG